MTAVHKAREMESGRPDLIAFRDTSSLARDARKKHCSLDNMDRAFEWLDKAIKARAWESPMIKANPVFERIRSDSRFPALLRRIGLPD